MEISYTVFVLRIVRSLPTYSGADMQRGADLYAPFQKLCTFGKSMKMCIQVLLSMRSS